MINKVFYWSDGKTQQMELVRPGIKYAGSMSARNSIYAEQIDAYHSVFHYYNGRQEIFVPFDRVLAQPFMQKYKIDYNIGVRFSFGFF